MAPTDTQQHLKELHSFGPQQGKRQHIKLAVISAVLIIILLIVLYAFVSQLLFVTSRPAHTLTGLWTCSFQADESQRIKDKTLLSRGLVLDVAMKDDSSGQATLRHKDDVLARFHVHYKWNHITFTNAGKGTPFSIDADVSSNRSALILEGHFASTSQSHGDFTGNFSARMGGTP
ncbi:MAG: hypothetical protein Q4P66_00795 [Actinomycetaceae bacterium]|nr:hypothetical protein [Actinomycetaceae bacterium]